MRIRIVGGIIVAACGMSLLGFTGVAGAQSPNASLCAPGRPSYPPNQSSLGVGRTDVPRGGQVEASGCASPNSQVFFTLFSHPKDLGSATADAAGVFRATLTIPCDAEDGAHTLRTSGGATAATALSVTGGTAICAASTGVDNGSRGTDTARSRGGLPRTGSSSTAPLAAAGVGLVLIGAATAVTARRRRAADAL